MGGAGRAGAGQPLGPADPGLWTAVAERVNPAKARPVLRAGIETVELVSARGVAYVMLRSPDRKQACYLRLTPEECRARPADGRHPHAGPAGRRVRPDLRPARARPGPPGRRRPGRQPDARGAAGRRVRARCSGCTAGRGRCGWAAGCSRSPRAAGWCWPTSTRWSAFLYRAGGRLLFTRAVGGAAWRTVAVVGLVAFGWQWWTGEQSVFLTDGLVRRRRGRSCSGSTCSRWPATSSATRWPPSTPAGGCRRPVSSSTSASRRSSWTPPTCGWPAGGPGCSPPPPGPAAGLVLAGASALVGLAVPEAAPWCFKLSFAWYINALFNLNPFLALDGYYLLMDWLEVPNLRARGLAWVAARLRRRPPAWRALDREGRLVALYGMLAVGWLVIARQHRLPGLRRPGRRARSPACGASGWPARVLLVVVVAALLSPLVYLAVRLARPAVAAARGSGWRERRVERRRCRAGWPRCAPRRCGDLPAAGAGRPGRPGPLGAPAHRRSSSSSPAPPSPTVFAVVDGALEGRGARRPGRHGAGTGRRRRRRRPRPARSPARRRRWPGTPPAPRCSPCPSAAVAAAVGPLPAAGRLGYGPGRGRGSCSPSRPALAGLSYEDTARPGRGRRADLARARARRSC